MTDLTSVVKMQYGPRNKAQRSSKSNADGTTSNYFRNISVGGRPRNAVAQDTRNPDGTQSGHQKGGLRNAALCPVCQRQMRVCLGNCLPPTVAARNYQIMDRNHKFVFGPNGKPCNEDGRSHHKGTTK